MNKKKNSLSDSTSQILNISYKLENAFRSIAPIDVEFSGGNIQVVSGSLYPVEYDTIRKAAPKRKAEFRAGRIHARNALRKIGCPRLPIRTGSNREPLWPSGFTGSISHSAELCCAVAALSDNYMGLGVDLEHTHVLDADLIDYVCDSEEYASIASELRLKNQLTDPGKLIFSIKEAVFKSYFPISNNWLGFRDLWAEIDATSSTFVVRVVKPCAVFGGLHWIRGRWTIFEEHVLTVAEISKS